jgi:uroporphyrin-III C-methyltransferase / precorrin-2 dehydrogenase / sirohydrochlorin ferrochelatase
VTDKREPAYLLGLRLGGKRVVVIGGGTVASRRVPALIAVGADVVMVSPEVSPSLEALVSGCPVRCEERDYQPGDCVGAWLVCACGPAEVNAAAAAEADAQQTWCVRSDDASASAAWTPAAGTVSGVQVGVLSGDPRRSARIRDAIATGLSTGTISARHYRQRSAGVALVGGGPGDPGLLTVRGRQLLADADVVVADRLAPRAVLGELAPDVLVIDAGKIPNGRAMSQREINELLIRHASAGRFVVRLKGGDPFVFGRGGEEMLACLRAGIPVTVVPGVTSAVGVPTAAGVPVTHRGTTQDFHIVSVHVPPGDDRSSVDWEALARGTGTLVLMMAVDRIGSVAQALIRFGRSANTPVTVIADGTMPTQRTMYATLDDVETRIADEGIRPPAVIVVGEVVAVAAELAGLARAVGPDRVAGMSPGGENQHELTQAGRWKEGA